MAKPFCKWAGGKGQLLEDILVRSPKKYGVYYEPFLGGGAVFFGLQPARAVLSDLNKELMRCYRVVRDDVQSLIVWLKRYATKTDEAAYYQVRGRYARPMTAVQAAGRFIYLNRLCFNGLYRVNSDGVFNVPYGRYKNPTICNTENLLACSAALNKTALSSGDFGVACRLAEQGDFVYLDPPFRPVQDGPNASFTQYQADGFDDAQHVRLAESFRDMDNRGCKILMSNSDHPLVRKLYKGFRIERVYARRNINSDGTGRGTVPELLIRNYA